MGWVSKTAESLWLGICPALALEGRLHVKQHFENVSWWQNPQTKKGKQPNKGLLLEETPALALEGRLQSKGSLKMTTETKSLIQSRKTSKQGLWLEETPALAFEGRLSGSFLNLPTGSCTSLDLRSTPVVDFSRQCQWHILRSVFSSTKPAWREQGLKSGASSSSTSPWNSWCCWNKTPAQKLVFVLFIDQHHISSTSRTRGLFGVEFQFERMCFFCFLSFEVFFCWYIFVDSKLSLAFVRTKAFSQYFSLLGRCSSAQRFLEGSTLSASQRGSAKWRNHSEGQRCEIPAKLKGCFQDFQDQRHKDFNWNISSVSFLKQTTVVFVWYF